MNIRVTELPEKPTLLMEFHGASQAAIEAELKLVQEVCDECKCSRFEAGVGRRRVRPPVGRAPHPGEILFSVYPNSTYLITDVSVPISAYPALAAYANGLYTELRAPRCALSAMPATATCTPLTSALKDNVDQQQRLQEFNDRVVQKAIALTAPAPASTA